MDRNDAQAETPSQKAQRILTQKSKDKSKLYAGHSPQVACISKGKVRIAYDFGVKVSVTAALKDGIVVGKRSMPGNPWDGHTLAETLEQVSLCTNRKPRIAIVDKGYQGVTTSDTPSLRSEKKRGITKTLRTMIKR